MPDFAGAILASHANFTSGGVGMMDPVHGSQNPTNLDFSQGSNSSESSADPGWQDIQKCRADYNQIPHGWRQSAFMGKCGYKIQARKFYSAETPCYPIQDLSCMGPTQKRVWANICATEFPCKALEPEAAKYVVSQAEPSWLSQILDDASKVLNSNILLILGLTFGSCMSVAMIGHQTSANKDESGSDD